MFRDDLNTLGDKIRGIEADTELANHGDVCASAESLHKALQRCIRTTGHRMIGVQNYFCPRLGNGTQVVDHVSLGHADTTVADGEHFILFVRDDTNEELLFRIEDGRIGEGSVANFVQSIGAIGDNFTKENLFVGIECV
jgi:hypothetical protein